MSEILQLCSSAPVSSCDHLQSLTDSDEVSSLPQQHATQPCIPLHPTVDQIKYDKRKAKDEDDGEGDGERGRRMWRGR